MEAAEFLLKMFVPAGEKGYRTVVTFHLRLRLALVVFLITQSIMRSKRKPNITQPSLNPVSIGKKSDVRPFSTTQQVLSS